MPYTKYLQHPDDKDQTGYSGTTMGSGRNSGEQEKESWKDEAAQPELKKSENKTSDESETKQGTPRVTRDDKNAHGQSGVVKIRK